MEKKSFLQKLIHRQRLSPRPWHPNFFGCRNNLKVFLKFRQLLAEKADQGKILRLLDVGCGYKPWQELFHNLPQVEYVGVDYDLAKSSADVEGRAEELPFPDNSFDGLIYSEVLEHVEFVDQALSEMVRVAKPGALVFISTPFFFHQHGRPYDFQRLTSFFYKKRFSSHQILHFSASNTFFATPFLVANLLLSVVLPLQPFLVPVYLFHNLLALCAEGLGRGMCAVVSAVFPSGEEVLTDYFLEGAPLGYALVVQVLK